MFQEDLRDFLGAEHGFPGTGERSRVRPQRGQELGVGVICRAAWGWSGVRRRGEEVWHWGHLLVTKASRAKELHETSPGVFRAEQAGGAVPADAKGRLGSFFLLSESM